MLVSNATMPSAQVLLLADTGQRDPKRLLGRRGHVPDKRRNRPNLEEHLGPAGQAARPEDLRQTPPPRARVAQDDRQDQHALEEPGPGVGRRKVLRARLLLPPGVERRAAPVQLQGVRVPGDELQISGEGLEAGHLLCQREKVLLAQDHRAQQAPPSQV